MDIELTGSLSLKSFFSRMLENVDNSSYRRLGGKVSSSMEKEIHSKGCSRFLTEFRIYWIPFRSFEEYLPQVVSLQPIFVEIEDVGQKCLKKLYTSRA
ncbi:hypothetical protein NPIL_93461 [Nephila pilipes]|uniref:Uncharacterized protein n=1 Tax=Nephila pilipes TaxID=299642 RepID=A0A8X6R355_NEPPI|nr:hypothetical protein NPIL_93461 [Nephila pilipes]